MLEELPIKLIGPEEDRAVSPVIGVILMVAITVILAAVIAAFVLDIGPGDTSPSAGVTTDIVDDDTVEVELNSLDGNADGVVVATGTDDSEEEDGFDDDPLTVTGENEDYDVDSDSVLIAYIGDGDEDDGTELSELDDFAIIDNLEEFDDD